MLETNRFYCVPAREAYPNERWRIVKQYPNLVTLMNVEGYKVSVHPSEVHPYN